MDVLKVHHETVDRTTGEQIINRVAPYIAIKQGHDPALFLKEGKLWDVSGNPPDVVPEWAFTQIQHLTDDALRGVKWDPEAVRNSSSIEEYWLKAVEQPQVSEAPRRGRR